MIRGNSNAASHAIASSRPSHRPMTSRHSARNKAHALPIRLSLFHYPGFFFKHAPQVVVYPLSQFPSRSSSRSISSCRASRSYIGLSIHAVFVILPRRAFLVGSCSSPSHRPASNMTSPSSQPSSSHISIVFSYPCILVSFIYIAYIIFIIHIYRRGMMNHATISKQAPAVSSHVPSASNRINGTGKERQSREQATGDDEPNGERRAEPIPFSHRMIGSRRERR